MMCSKLIYLQSVTTKKTKSTYHLILNKLKFDAGLPVTYHSFTFQPSYHMALIELLGCHGMFTNISMAQVESISKRMLAICLASEKEVKSQFDFERQPEKKEARRQGSLVSNGWNQEVKCSTKTIKKGCPPTIVKRVKQRLEHLVRGTCFCFSFVFVSKS